MGGREGRAGGRKLHFREEGGEREEERETVRDKQRVR